MTAPRKITPQIASEPVPEALLTMADLGAWLGVSVGTIRKWRVTGVGPAGLKIGKHVRYRRSTVEAWLETTADAA